VSRLKWIPVREELQNPGTGGRAVLAWAVEGCRLYREAGLTTPQAVEQATMAYRKKLDPLADWFEDCCELVPESWEATADLRRSYAEWLAAEEPKAKGMSARTFSMLLPANRPGIRPDRQDKKRVHWGVRLSK
jgi:putative DNA primase/helicase